MTEFELLKNIEELGFIANSAGYKNGEEYDNGNHNWRYWEIPSENYRLYGTHFFEKNEKEFIHFTSLDSFYSIFNTGEIRLYNLPNMDDKLEMEYARNELNFREPFSKDKEDLYCFSMCRANDILKSEMKEHLLWKLHGRDGNGVLLKISFQNDPKHWYNYHLSKVFYDLDIAQPIKKLHSITKKEILDVKFCSFFKMNIYEFEKETSGFLP